VRRPRAPMPQAARPAVPRDGAPRRVSAGGNAPLSPQRRSMASTRRVPAVRWTGARSSSGSKSTETSPKRRVAPGLSATSPSACSPSTKVPLVDALSLMIQMFSRRCSLAWLVLTLGSGSTRSLNSARPMLTIGVLMGSRCPLSSPLRTSIDASGATVGAVGVVATLDPAETGSPCMVSESRAPAPVGGPTGLVVSGTLRGPRGGGGGAASA